MSFARREIDAVLADIRRASGDEGPADTGYSAACRTDEWDGAAEWDGATRQWQDRERLAAERRILVDQRDDAARRGEFGQDWQELQERIDRGQTTLGRVLTGADDSDLALRIQDLTARNLATITGEMAEHGQVTGGEWSSELDQAFADLRVSMERAAVAAQQAMGSGRI